jgi:glycosyltransferase involved in cell wall biosynthesis
MRVTIASRIFLPETSAASFRLDALARSLVRHGHEVTVLTATTPAAMGAYEPAEYRIRRRAVLRGRDGYVRGYLQYLSYDVPLAFRLLFSRRPGVVVAEPPPTTGAVVRAVCALRGIPYVYYAADIWSDASSSIGAPSLVVRMLRVVERSVLRRAASVLTVNDDIGRRIAELAQGSSITVVGNGVDTAIFCAAGARASEGRYAIYAGTMSEWQGVDVFVRALPEALAAVPDARVVFLGQGTAVPELIRLTAELGLADWVEFRPPVPAAEAAVWIRGAVVALVGLAPGAGYDFALPTKVLAAICCGTPVIFSGSDVGPTPALLADSPRGLAGRAVGTAPAEIAAALAAALASPLAQADRAELAGWAAEVASLDAVADRAAAVIGRAGRA